MKYRAWLVLLAGALAGAACKDGPKAGELPVSLVTPNSDDGAIMFQANAVAPQVITGFSSQCANCKLFVVKISDTQYKGVLTGDIAAGTVFRVGVDDINKKELYTLQILSVSNRTSVLRSTPLTGYSMNVQ